jgi:hypothetical protein
MLRTVKRLALLFAFPAVATASPALACDGNPPKVANRDNEVREVVITCGSKAEKLTLKANAVQELRGKPGCTIQIGDGKPIKLSTEMVCTISGGKISCDLL